MTNPADIARGELQSRFAEVRAATLALCEPLEIEDTVIQSMTDVSPPKWHLGHTTWFFETFVVDHAVVRYRAVDPLYRTLFNSYYDTVGAQHPRDRRGQLARPTLGRVLAYRTAVDQRVAELIQSAGDDSWPELASRIVLGLHHEQQHQELLLMDVKHNLHADPTFPTYRSGLAGLAGPAAPSSAPLSVEWIAVRGGEHEIGHPGEGFAFDNELPRHRVTIADHRIASRLVTSGEWREFIDDGGYDRSGLWLADGWKMASDSGWQAPLYWQRRAGGWHQFTLGGWREVDDAEPVVHVSYYEADAFARWRGARLPTEAEWEVQARQRRVGGNLVESGLLHPRPSREGGVDQLFGDVWEWTASSYSGYPGYRPLAGSLGEYNGKFMCNQLVLRGGSCATPASHIRATYRNYYYPHQRWCFAGVRLARS